MYLRSPEYTLVEMIRDLEKIHFSVKITESHPCKYLDEIKLAFTITPFRTT